MNQVFFIPLGLNNKFLIIIFSWIPNIYWIGEKEENQNDAISLSSAGWGVANLTTISVYNQTSHIKMNSIPPNTLWKYNITFQNYDPSYRSDYYTTALFIAGKDQYLRFSIILNN